MASVNVAHGVEKSEVRPANSSGDTLALLAIAALVTILHLLTNGRYGIHRDELQFLSDARHMDWGFVPYPPFTPLDGANQPFDFRPVSCGATTVFGDRAGRCHRLHGPDGSRVRRRTTSPDHGSFGDRVFSAAAL